MQANSGDSDQMPHFVASDLGLHYLPMSRKKDARHIWVKKCNYFAYLIRVAERGSFMVWEINMGICPRLEFDIMFINCLGYDFYICCI